MKTLPQCLLKCLKRKENKQSGGCKSPLFIIMKESTMQEIYNALDDEVFATLRVVQERSGYSKAATYEAISNLMIDDKVEQIYVKHSLSRGRAEAAYRKADI